MNLHVSTHANVLRLAALLKTRKFVKCSSNSASLGFGTGRTVRLRNCLLAILMFILLADDAQRTFSTGTIRKCRNALRSMFKSTQSRSNLIREDRRGPMNFKLKTAAAAILAASLVVSYASASGQTPSAKKHVATKKAKTPPGPTVEEQIQSLRQEFQGQIDGLKSNLADKDAQLKQAQQAAADAQAAAAKAQAAADAQQQAVADNAAAASTLKATVDDMQAM